MLAQEEYKIGSLQYIKPSKIICLFLAAVNYTQRYYYTIHEAHAWYSNPNKLI